MASGLTAAQAAITALIRSSGTEPKLKLSRMPRCCSAGQAMPRALQVSMIRVRASGLYRGLDDGFGGIEF